MTKIQWTDETWNPVIGCSKVHTGCTHCYAEVMAARPLSAFVDKHNLTVTNGRWNGRIIEQPERLLLPLSWKKPRRIFVASMSDLGHPGLSDEKRARIYGVMLLMRRHTFQNLTKRPAEIERFKREFAPSRCLLTAMRWIDTNGIRFTGGVHFRGEEWSDVPNIHEYVSVSDQATADEFISQLLRVPAAVRGVSLEPMVGRVNLAEWIGRKGAGGGFVGHKTPALDHVIVGGESGRKARPCDVEWIRSVVGQCRDAGVPCFVKQLGSRPMVTNASPDNGRLFGQKTDGDWARFNIRLNGGEVRDNDRTLYPKLSPKGGDLSEWPADLRVRMHVGEGWRC